MWYAPLPPHSLENVGMTEIHVLTVELKDEINLSGAPGGRALPV
jgi:hypothetical protein